MYILGLTPPPIARAITAGIRQSATANSPATSVKTRASRAVGAADERRPDWGFLLLCHRVIGANGGLTGYAGGLLRNNGCSNMERLFHAPACEKAVSKTADRSECSRLGPRSIRTLSLDSPGRRIFQRRRPGGRSRVFRAR